MNWLKKLGINLFFTSLHTSTESHWRNFSVSNIPLINFVHYNCICFGFYNLSHLEKGLNHFEKVLKHFEKVLKHFEKVLKHFEKVPKHFENILKHFEKPCNMYFVSLILGKYFSFYILNGFLKFPTSCKQIIFLLKIVYRCFVCKNANMLS